MAYPHIHADLLIFCYPNCVCHMFTLISIELLSIELSSFTWLKKKKKGKEIDSDPYMHLNHLLN